jgi:hypothetical protein
MNSRATGRRNNGLEEYVPKGALCRRLPRGYKHGMRSFSCIGTQPRSDGSSKFIFDLIEPEHPNVDRAMLNFVKEQVFDPADFVIRADRVWCLNPETARKVVAIASHKVGLQLHPKLA